MKKIQMVDLKSQYEKIKDTVNASIQEVLETNAYINGPQVHQFQKSLEEYLEFLKDFKNESKQLRTEKFGKLMEISYLEKGKFDQMENQLNSIIQISGNNTDGYILTQWRQANEVS